MADSLGQSFKASEFGVKSGKKKDKQEGLDTPEKKESRLSLYEQRASMRGPNGRPLNIFTGEEYTEDEVTGIEEDECEE